MMQKMSKNAVQDSVNIDRPRVHCKCLTFLYREAERFRAKEDSVRQCTQELSTCCDMAISGSTQEENAC